MKKEMIIAPSLLAADFKNLGEEVTKLLQNGIKYLHFDVMDGHFVPNLSFGIPVLEALKPHFPFVYDVHLMVSNPEFIALKFIDAGADIITFHYEAMANNEEVFALIKKIKDRNVKVGISVKPHTDVEVLYPFLSSIDLVLIMSVEPGFGGQKFMDNALEKIRLLSKLKKENAYHYLIEVDGGINHETGKKCKEAGVEILVAGSYLFGKDDQKERIAGLKDGR